VLRKEVIATSIFRVLNTVWETETFSVVEVYKRFFNTLRTGDADLRVYITTVQDG
jgi:hypothetical protein